jgi:hypothetical protein
VAGEGRESATCGRHRGVCSCAEERATALGSLPAGVRGLSSRTDQPDGQTSPALGLFGTRRPGAQDAGRLGGGDEAEERDPEASVIPPDPRAVRLRLPWGRMETIPVPDAGASASARRSRRSRAAHGMDAGGAPGQDESEPARSVSSRQRPATDAQVTEAVAAYAADRGTPACKARRLLRRLAGTRRAPEPVRISPASPEAGLARVLDLVSAWDRTIAARGSGPR